MKTLLIEITDELDQVLRTISERIANGDLGKLSQFAELIDSPKIGPLIEQLLRKHPAVELVRKECKLKWVERKSVGRPKKLPPAE